MVKGRIMPNGGGKRKKRIEKWKMKRKNRRERKERK